MTTDIYIYIYNVILYREKGAYLDRYTFVVVLKYRTQQR